MRLCSLPDGLPWKVMFHAFLGRHYSLGSIIQTAEFLFVGRWADLRAVSSLADKDKKSDLLLNPRVADYVTSPQSEPASCYKTTRRRQKPEDESEPVCWHRRDELTCPLRILKTWC